MYFASGSVQKNLKTTKATKVTNKTKPGMQTVTMLEMLIEEKQTPIQTQMQQLACIVVYQNRIGNCSSSNNVNAIANIIVNSKNTNTTGTATVLYDPSLSAANEFLNTIFENEQPETELTFELNSKNKTLGGGNIVTKGFLTSVSPSTSVGAVSAVSINFQVNGKPVTGAF